MVESSKSSHYEETSKTYFWATQVSRIEDYYLLKIYTSTEKFTSQTLAVMWHDAELFNLIFNMSCTNKSRYIGSEKC
jgi:GT2 family glycosyltransferase